MLDFVCPSQDFLNLKRGAADANVLFCHGEQSNLIGSQASDSQHAVIMGFFPIAAVQWCMNF